MSSNSKTNISKATIFTGSNRFTEDSSLSESGYNVIHEASFIMTLSYTDDCPEAQAILSYSQSGDPRSPHFSDQNELYADERWRDIHFITQTFSVTLSANAHFDRANKKRKTAFSDQWACADMVSAVTVAMVCLMAPSNSRVISPDLMPRTKCFNSGRGRKPAQNPF